MNYRHAYHAGNFADVLKHLTLALVIEYLKRKEAAFRVIDTHAGCGRYALGSIQSTKTGEWRGGIGRLLGPDARPLPSDVARVMAPYLDAVCAVNPPRQLEVYPGSPLVARRLLREGDVLVANELHPEDWTALKAALGCDRRVKLLALDGWMALKSLLPPKERRGVVLIDPPFEEQGEIKRLADGLAEALRRFETGICLAWYPIKDSKPIAAFHAALADWAGVELLRVELMVRGGNAPDRLNGCGLIVANPPYTLREQLAAVLPELTQRLAEGSGARYRLDYVAHATRDISAPKAGSHRRRPPPQ
ncbi:MAG: 23S rRNA (adenine(2030)-N(6))-methyltransferase RlmJ [Rhodospirillales bacterium]|nr:23S rRNA (adenine(2030)-N(6))-methyltransferase RlmJ [Rhodospirillales bacterium]